MKITFVLPYISMTGGVRVAVTYADRLRKRGHQVHIVHKPFPATPMRAQISSLIKGRSTLSNEKCKISDFGIADIPNTLIRHPGPIVDTDLPNADVVVATWWETVEWVANLSNEKGVKVHFVQHHEVFDYLPVERVKAAYRLPMYRIAVAQWLVDVLTQDYKCRHVDLVPNAIDHRRFVTTPRAKGQVPTVGLFYALPYWKGCETSIAAYQLAKQRIPNLQLVAFGALKPSAHLKLPSDVAYHCRPQSNDLPQIYAQCDAWLFASRVEGFGLPILEAMACRTPVIATMTGAAPELLSKGGGVLLDNPEDIQGMASAIESICHLSDEQWQEMSNIAYAVATRYTLDDATSLFERALESAVVHHQESRCGI